MRHFTRLAAAVCVVVLAAGCGSGDGDDSGDAADEPTSTPTTSTSPDEPTESAGSAETADPSASASDEPAEPEGTVIEVSLRDGTVTPSGERVEVEAGQPVTFEIDSDADGELHVHSNPEHSLEFGPGTSSQSITIDQPGVVEVELHDPAALVVQLEVR